MSSTQGEEMTTSERAFLKKYLGIDDPSMLQGLMPVDGVPVAGMALSAVRSAVARSGDAAVPASAEEEDPAHEAIAPAAQASGEVLVQADGSAGPATEYGLVTEKLVRTSVDAMLPTLEIVTLVGFYISGDVFVIPIDSVKEVIRYEEPYKLPMSPSYMTGVVNLRGRILPVMRLSDMLITQTEEVQPISKSSLIIICEAHGLQIGLLVDKLHTMFKSKQDDITWNAEVHLGPSAELLSGLLETGEKLLGIVSAERLVDKLLSE